MPSPSPSPSPKRHDLMRVIYILLIRISLSVIKINKINKNDKYILKENRMC